MVHAKYLEIDITALNMKNGCANLTEQINEMCSLAQRASTLIQEFLSDEGF